MRHLKHRHQLGRKKEHRQATLANMATALLTHDRIKTTLPKAKALRPFVEKIITLAKHAKGATPERAAYLRQLAQSRVRDTDAVTSLFDEKVEEFTSRDGGYTRIYKLGHRVGDAAEMAVIQLISADDEGYGKRGRRSTAKPSPESDSESVEGVAEDATEAVAENPVEADEQVEEVTSEAASEEVVAEEATEVEDKEEKSNG